MSEQEFVQGYIKELSEGPQTNLFAQPDLSDQVPGLIDGAESGLPFPAHLEIGIDCSSLLYSARKRNRLLFSHASELFHNVVGV